MRRSMSLVPVMVTRSGSRWRYRRGVCMV
jgi:hypothetical protein